MADIVKVVSLCRREAKTLFAAHDGTVYVEVHASQEGAVEWWDIYAVDAVTVADFNEAPIGSKLFDSTDGGYYLHTGATTWVSFDVT